MWLRKLMLPRKLNTTMTVRLFLSLFKSYKKSTTRCTILLVLSHHIEQKKWSVHCNWFAKSLNAYTVLMFFSAQKFPSPLQKAERSVSSEWNLTRDKLKNLVVQYCSFKATQQIRTVSNVYLLRLLSTFQLDPETCNIHQKSNHGDDEEFQLQMRCDHFQQEFNFRFQHGTDQE